MNLFVVTFMLISHASSETATRGLSLSDAVALAMELEPVVRQAGVSRDRAELGVLRAELDRFSLRVDAQLQELWAKSDIGGARGDAFVGSLGLSNVSASLTVPVFTGFRIEATIDRAVHLEAAAAQDVTRARKDTALAVARAYWVVRKLGLLAETQAHAVERLKNAEEIAESRVRAGLAPPIDRNRAASRRMQQQASLADLQGSLAEANAKLAVALGVREELELTDRAEVPDAPPPAIGTLLDRATKNRPELLAASRRFEAELDAVRIEESRYYPELSAFSLLQYGNNPFLAGAGSRAVFGSSNPFENAAGDFQIGATLSINLFDTLHTYTAVQDAEHRESLALEETRRVLRLVESEVRSARARVIHFHEVRARLLPAQEIAHDNVSIIQRRYENGDALVFELLDAEVELLGVERQLADAASELRLAWLELDASLGLIVGEQQ